MSRKNIFKQGLFNTIFLYAGLIFGVCNTILKARALSPEEIGVIAIITALTSIVSSVMTMGIPHAVRMFYNRFNDKINTKSGFILFCLFVPAVNFLLLSLIFMLLRNWIIGIYDNQLFTGYFNFLYWFFLSTNLATVIKYIFESEYRSIIANIYYDFVWRITNFVFLILMLNYQTPFFYYLLFTLVSIYIRVFIYFYYFRKINFTFKASFEFIDRPFLKEFFRYSIITFVSGLTGIMTETVDKLMIGYYLNMEDVGYYAIIAQLAALIKMISYGFNRISYPLAAEYMGRNEIENVAKLYKKTSTIQVYLGLVIFLVLFNFPTQVLSILGDRYSGEIWILMFLCSAYLLDISTGNNIAIILYSKYYHYDFILRTIEVLITIITNIIFIPIFGVSGAAFATFLAFLSFVIMKIFVVWIKFKIQPYSKDTVKLLFNFILFLFVIRYFKHIIIVDGILPLIVFSIIVFVIYTLSSVFVFRVSIIPNYKKFIHGKKNG